MPSVGQLIQVSHKYTGRIKTYSVTKVCKRFFLASCEGKEERFNFQPSTSVYEAWYSGYIYRE